MSRTGLLAVLLFTGLLIAFAALLPDQQNRHIEETPWNITLSPQGNSQVLGITLEESSVEEALTHWEEAPEITIFVKEGVSTKVEAFFEQVNLGGIRATIVAEIEVADEQLNTLIDQGARISTQGDGSRKIEVDGPGMRVVEQSPIISLTYMPKANLPPETIEKRFGKPEYVFELPEGITHWIYPQQGLDIVISAETKEVLQYVSPKRIERLLTPLQQAAATSG